MAGITKDTPNPMGGTYDKDPDGELNGRVTDRAMDAVRQGRHAAHLHRRRTGDSAAATASPTSPSSSPATA